MGDQSVNVSGSGNRVIAHSTNVQGVEREEIKQGVEILLVGLQREEGALTIGYSETAGWVVGLHFGHEAEGSDMAGGASYGTDPSLAEALRVVIEETGWDRR